MIDQTNAQPTPDDFEVLTPEQVADLKQAWLSGKGLTRLPPIANLIFRLIATIERARGAFETANRKWDEAETEVHRLRGQLDEARAKNETLEARLAQTEGREDLALDRVRELESRLKAAETALEEMAMSDDKAISFMGPWFASKSRRALRAKEGK